MTECNVTFSSDNSPLFELYQTLIKEGLDCAELDVGHRVIRRDDETCAIEHENSCIHDKGDGFIQPGEVFEFAFNNYEKYRETVELTLNNRIPWTLSDFDPTTKFDAEIRSKIEEAIVFLENEIKNSVNPGQKLAIGLFYLAAMPNAKLISERPDRFDVRAVELESVGLPKFKEYLKAHGGFRVKQADNIRRTALEALKTNSGGTLEKASILYAIFSKAGLKPRFVLIERDDFIDGVSRSRDPQIRELARNVSEDYNHICVSLTDGKETRLFDPVLLDSDAQYKNIHPLSLWQYYDFAGINPKMEEIK